MRCAIVYLTQNSEYRRWSLGLSLHFLFRNFNGRFQYPVIIAHEGDYDSIAQEQLLNQVDRDYWDLISFLALDPDCFALPSHIDEETLTRTIELNPFPGWRDRGYRLMCRWWLIHMPELFAQYDYVMRLDDDSLFEENLSWDVFAWAARNDLLYAFNHVVVDNPAVTVGLKQFLCGLAGDRRDLVERLFVPVVVGREHTAIVAKLRSVGLELPVGDCGSPLSEEEQWVLDTPITYFNNFHVTKPQFWLRSDVRDAVVAIDRTGGIFYRRWGDAPIQTVLVALFAGENAVSRCAVGYSKRQQRTADKYSISGAEFLEKAVRDELNSSHLNKCPKPYERTGSLTDLDTFRKLVRARKIEGFFE